MKGMVEWFLGVRAARKLAGDGNWREIDLAGNGNWREMGIRGNGKWTAHLELTVWRLEEKRKKSN